MSDIQFHQTAMGRKFFEHTMPELVRAVERLAGKVERGSDARYSYARCDAGWELRSPRGNAFIVLADPTHEREGVALIIVEALSRTEPHFGRDPL